MRFFLHSSVVADPHEIIEPPVIHQGVTVLETGGKIYTRLINLAGVVSEEAHFIETECWHVQVDQEDRVVG